MVSHKTRRCSSSSLGAPSCGLIWYHALPLPTSGRPHVVENLTPYPICVVILTPPQSPPKCHHVIVSQASAVSAASNLHASSLSSEVDHTSAEVAPLGMVFS